MVFHIQNYMRETNTWMIRKGRWIFWTLGGSVPFYRNIETLTGITLVVVLPGKSTSTVRPKRKELLRPRVRKPTGVTDLGMLPYMSSPLSRESTMPKLMKRESLILLE